MDSTNSGGFDASLLEGLPINQFNWGEWNVSPILFLPLSTNR
jgi:hypothetical protein